MSPRRRLTRPGCHPAAILLLPGVALVAACGQPGSPATSAGASSHSGSGAPPATPSVMAPVRVGDVVLRATMGIGFAQYRDDPAIRRRPGLVVDYTLQHTGARALVALDRVPASLGSSTLPAELNPEHAWVYRSGDVLRVSKQGFDARVRFMAAPVMGARELPPGGTLTGRAVVDVPVVPDLPGEEFTTPRSSADAGRASEWQFCVQLAPRPSGGTAAGTERGVLATPFSAPGPDELVCTATTRLELP